MAALMVLIVVAVVVLFTLSRRIRHPRRRAPSLSGWVATSAPSTPAWRW